MLRRFRNFLLVEESSDVAADVVLERGDGVAVAVAGAAVAAALLRSEALEKGPIYACRVEDGIRVGVVDSRMERSGK